MGKVCKECGIEKPLEDFYLTTYARRHGTSSRFPYCKVCWGQKNQAKYAADPEKHKAMTKAALERRKAIDLEGFQRARRNTYFLNVYGITLVEWEQLWENQNGMCPICEEAFQTEADAHLDHDHETGAIRGLLCRACNPGLGLFKDSVDLLEAAIHYLQSPLLKKDEGHMGGGEI